MKRYILLLIFLIGAFFRFYELTNIPPAPSLDEVTLTYNAYSILETGKDEYAETLPILLRAYDDYRPALYVYLTIPFVWLLGLTPLAVRLPSVMLSMVTLYITYLLARMIGKKYLGFPRLGDYAVALLAISPWHIYISRLGHEANVGLTLTALGVYTFLRSVMFKKPLLLIASGALFGLSLHGYQSQKVITPLLLLGGVMLFRDKLWKMKKSAVLGTLVCLLVAIPAIWVTFSPEGLIRFRGTSAFSPDSPMLIKAQDMYAAAKGSGDRLGQIRYSRYVVYASQFAKNYISHFSPMWLYTGTDREAHKVPGLGLMYPWEAPLLIFGLWALWKSQTMKQTSWFLLLYVLIAPIPASITTQAPHAMRSYTIIPVIQIIEAIGLWYSMRKLSRRQLPLAAAVAGVVVAMGIASFWRGYFVRFPKEQSDSFQYALGSAISYALNEKGNYERIEFSNQGALYQSYMFYLYYSQLNPKQYQRLGGTESGGYDAAHYLGDVAFGFLPKQIQDFKPRTLYFYDIKEMPDAAFIIRRFANLDGVTAIVAVRN